MSPDTNPFGALDKMLLYSSAKEKKVPKPAHKPLKKKPDSKGKPKETANNVPSPSISRLSQSTGSVNQSSLSVDRTNRPDQSTRLIGSTSQLMGVVVKRPLAFYIPEVINQQLEAAVRYYQQTANKKIDRSAVVSALLGDPKIWQKETLDRLADKVLEQLKNRLSDRLSNQLAQSTGTVDPSGQPVDPIK
ncbi:MAG: hypothetical protein U0401_28830 [Anaerolineae bacterium]